MLDPKKKYLLARPRGGLNDQLTQIEKVATYAEKYGRVLILDTTKDGLRAPFSTLFEWCDDSVEVEVLDDAVHAACDQTTSIYPVALKHRVSSYTSYFLQEKLALFDTETDVFISFDFSKDYPQQLLVFEQCGGWAQGGLALQRMRFRPDVANAVAKRLVPLGRDYDAVHIRHSDYLTAFETFLKRIKPAVLFRKVLICSDSVVAKDAASEILHRSTTVMSVANIPDMNGVPLHLSKDVDVQETNLDLLTDLCGMALSQILFFTHIQKEFALSASYSGFSLLAELLRRRRDIVQNMLHHAEPADREALFGGRMKRRGILRMLQIRLQKRMNADVYANARVKNIPLTRKRLEPEQICKVQAQTIALLE